MRIAVTVLVVLVVVLLTLVGVYGATSVVLSSGGEDIEDEGSSIASCLGTAVLGDEDNECDIFGASEDD